MTARGRVPVAWPADPRAAPECALSDGATPAARHRSPPGADRTGVDLGAALTGATG
ncbi:hypothetical protein [Dactylosporangium matsuzakiense]|uniref:Uncharacterized protein n=1 Tax=Dactylosporangium matsuzakiense TaxID=53360 RepID=A0A9W6KFD4_9ACTN|nr:hypothetical protein [Dactylosporangium matsuzakiense]UWZ48829.1 hypothetical protein Dmats_21950 [Dactylosporangium matsuzakiense]GLL01066.1 hypothetical protein GCM10017581_028070 [Dactylosporangium matsuzakiense]